MTEGKPSGDEQARGPGQRQVEEQGRADQEARLIERLKPYGLSPEDLHPEPVAVPPRTTLRLDAKDKAQGVVALRPSSIADVKRWIGTSDEVVRRAGPEHTRGPRLKVSSISAGRDLTPKRTQSLREIGKAYVYGDSKHVAGYEKMLAPLLAQAVIVGIFIRPDIDIYGTLEIGASVKVLWANKITIWPGGLLRLTGDAKVDASEIEVKTQFELHPWVVDYVPKIGALTRLEDHHD